MIERKPIKIANCKSKIENILVFYILCTLLSVISTSACSQVDSVLTVVPEGTVVCLRLENLKDFDQKIGNLMSSLNIPNFPPVSIATPIGKMLGSDLKSMKDVENAGFDVGKDVCIFWPGLSLKKVVIAAYMSSRSQVELRLKGTTEKYKDITYVLDESSAWAFLGDIFVYSSDKAAIMDIIKTHLNEKPSILHDESYIENIKLTRTGAISSYADLDKIVSAYLPDLRSKSQKLKENLSEQMKQQKDKAPGMNIDPSKIVGVEIDMALWMLQQMSSYAVSMDIRADGIWLNDALRFKSDSPVCNFLNIKPRRLNLIDYLPGDMILAGGATIDIPSFEKINSVMFNLILPSLQEKMEDKKIKELWERYDDAVHEILSCLGDEVAFAVPAKSDRMMPSFVYIFKVADEDKARKTITNLDYIVEISQPFYKAFGMDFPMTEGPTQKHNGIQINSFQMDMSQMARFAPNAANMYPEKAFIWYAFMDDKLIYAMSQSADVIKVAIDAAKGRGPSITNSQGFDDINIHLPVEANSIVYISPAGYINLVMGMMLQMSQGMPPGAMPGPMKTSIGFAVATELGGDNIQNLTYFRVQEIQNLVSYGLGLAQMMKPQATPQGKK